MKTSDIIGLVVGSSFGLWWVAFPKSVINFYTAFHGAKVKMPKPIGVRIAGAAWLILFAAVWIFGRKNGPL